MPTKHPDQPNYIPPQPAGHAVLIAALLLSPLLALATLNHLTNLWIRSTALQIGLLLAASALWTIPLYFAAGTLTRRLKETSRNTFLSTAAFCILLAGVLLMPFLKDFTPLPPGERQLAITATGLKNAAASSPQIKILEVNVADGQHVPLHTLEPRGEWTRLDDPQPALVAPADRPASLSTRFFSQWGLPVTILAESGPDSGILRVEIDDLQSEFDLYAREPGMRLLSLKASTAPFAWKLLLYSADILLLAFLLLLGGSQLFAGRSELEGLFERRPRQAAAAVSALVAFVFLTGMAFFLPAAWQKANGSAALQAGMTLWDPWELVFMLNFLLLSLGLGIFLLRRETALPAPPLSRFLFGVCLAPILLGLWMLFCAAILPGAPAPLFLFPPSAAGLAYSLLNRRSFSLLWRDIQQGLQAESQKTALVLAWLCLAVVLAQISSTLLVNSRSLSLQNDTNIYRSMAQPFARTRSLGGIPSFDGSSHPNLPGDVHNYLFQGYLAYAMLHADPDEVGSPEDKPVNDAYQVLFFYLILAVTALLWNFSFPAPSGQNQRAFAVPLTLLIMLQVSQIGIIGHIFSRDAYRIIPLLLLLHLLGTFDLSRPLRARQDALRLFLLGLVALYCLAGHTLGGIFCVLISAAWLLWQLILHRRLQLLSLILAFSAIGLGLLAGSQKYILSYLQFGTVHANIPEIVTRGTEYPEIIVQVRDARYNEIYASSGLGSPLLTTAIVVLERDRYMVILPGMAAGLFLLFRRLQKPDGAIPDQLLFWSLASLLIFFPFTGFLDIGRIILSNAFVGNLRYSLQYYPIFAAILAAALLNLENTAWIKSKLKNLRLYKNAILVLVLALFISCLSALNRQDDNFWRISNLAGNQLEYSESITPIRLIQKEIAPRKVLHQKASFAYHLDENALYLYTLAGQDIITSKTMAEASRSLREAGVGAVVINRSDLERGMQKTALYDYLQNSGEAQVTHENNTIRIYRLPE